jgi:hypothetical protein
MATDRQIEANRNNAQHGTGPKTAEGKAKSSQNALKTGLHAKSDVIATENSGNFDTLIAEYYERFHPATPEERNLVDELIRAEWLGRRYMAATAAIWEFDFRAIEQQDIGLTFMRNAQTLGRAQRCITATQRSFALALKQLLALQSQRTSEPPCAPEKDEETKPLRRQLVSFFPPDLPIPESAGQPELAAQEDTTIPKAPPIAA